MHTRVLSLTHTLSHTHTHRKANPTTPISIIPRRHKVSLTIMICEGGLLQKMFATLRVLWRVDTRYRIYRICELYVNGWCVQSGLRM